MYLSIERISALSYIMVNIFLFSLSSIGRSTVCEKQEISWNIFVSKNILSWFFCVFFDAKIYSVKPF